MKFRILIFALFIILSYPLARGSDVDYQVITMFQEGAVEMPGEAETADVADVNFEPEIIKDILLEHTAEVISVAFPGFDLADTLIESPRFPGLFARQARLDLIYRIQLAEDTLRDELNAALEEFDEVYFSDKNGTSESFYEPHDIHFPEQWGMNSDDENAGLPENITIAWKANIEPDMDGFMIIRRHKESSDLDTLGTVDYTVTSYVDTDIPHEGGETSNYVR